MPKSKAPRARVAARKQLQSSLELPAPLPGGFPRIGISGWTYPPWRRVFYPEGLPQKQELAWASRSVNSIEINGTFYSLQRPESFRKWSAEVPADFVFSLKGPRFITHMRRLREVDEALANFLASGPLCLGEKWGPTLWQLPPNFQFDAERIESFLAKLPRSHAEAAEVARQHGPKLKGRAWLEPSHEGPLRHALEVRHESFATPEFVALLRRQKVALVVADTGGKWPHLEDLTADFVYVRLHGPEELYVSGYSEQVLDDWADRIRTWMRGAQMADAHLAGKREARSRAMKGGVYVYFDNDAKVRAPFDAQSLARRFA